jgi:hypothetical protein
MTEISNRGGYSTPTILTPKSPQNWALTSIGVSLRGLTLLGLGKASPR